MADDDSLLAELLLRRHGRRAIDIVSALIRDDINTGDDFWRAVTRLRTDASGDEVLTVAVLAVVLAQNLATAAADVGPPDVTPRRLLDLALAGLESGFKAPEN